MRLIFIIFFLIDSKGKSIEWNMLTGFIKLEAHIIQLLFFFIDKLLCSAKILNKKFLNSPDNYYVPS